MAIGIILPWFITLKYISLVSAYIYLVIFTVIEVYALTTMANLLVKFDNGTNRGFIFGSSRLLLSIATVIVMNLVPHLFYCKETVRIHIKFSDRTFYIFLCLFHF